MPPSRSTLLLLLTLVFCRPAAADDPIVVKAMTATTIAEVFVNQGGIRVELEIGMRDLTAFRNALPNELHERLGLGSEPLRERLVAFFREDWILRLEGRGPLLGKLERVEGRRRVPRDPITGEPLLAQKDEGEAVLFVVLAYAFEGRPKTLTFEPPMRRDSRGPSANVGFVVYHRGLPVNDFRYLSQAENLDLDWDDPWFSRFRNKNLRRQHRAPISAYLYIDHFEVRKEVILRPWDVQHWIDLDLQGRDTISVESQAEIMRRVTEFLAARGTVRVDGREVELRLERVHFLRRSLRQTGVVDPPQELDVHSATLGVIFVCPIDRLPQRVTLDWDLFHPKFPSVPAWATDEAGGLPSTLTADDPVLTWQNFLTNPQVPAMLAIAPPAAPLSLRVSVLSTMFGAAMVVLLLWRGATWRRVVACAGLAAACLVAMPYVRIVLPVPFAGAPTLAADQTEELLGSLLHNLYRAFDYRDEQTIYDMLARTVSGELLTDVYLETRRALEIENQGGARARVLEVELVAVTSGEFREDGFDARCTWIVSGSVGHWGHIHQRRNRYEASFTLSAADGSWKISGLRLLSEDRL